MAMMGFIDTVERRLAGTGCRRRLATVFSLFFVRSFDVNARDCERAGSWEPKYANDKRNLHFMIEPSGVEAVELTPDCVYCSVSLPLDQCYQKRDLMRKRFQFVGCHS
jgi:hypothetical protein